MNNWEENRDWKELPKPEIGDIVHLKFSDAFIFLVKPVIIGVEKDKITATVEALFDWDTKGWVTGGEKTGLVGKEISFNPKMVHKVIKKSA